MRVVLLGTEFNMTGAALLLFRWATHLRRRGHDIIAVHDASVTGPLREAYLAEGSWRNVSTSTVACWSSATP